MESDRGIYAGLPESWGNRWFWRLVLYLALGMMVCAGLLNFIVNPFELYIFNFFPPAEVNPRELKTQYIKEQKPPAEVLIIGSSRVFSFDPEYIKELTGKQCFNFGGPSAMTEDYYATIRYVREDCKIPIDTVIVGIDLEAFHPTKPVQPQGQFLKEYAKYFTPPEDAGKLMVQRILMLFSMEQTGESISVLRRALRKDVGTTRLEYRPDGMAIMRESESAIEHGEFKLSRKIGQRIRKYPERSLGLSAYKDLSKKRKGFWMDFLKYCEENHIKVYAFVTPYHPEVLRVIRMQGGDAIIDKFTDYVSGTAKQAGVVFKDYLNVDSFGGNPNLFYDEIHMRPENCRKLVKHLLEDGETE